jgi:hypothetical protein
MMISKRFLLLGSLSAVLALACISLFEFLGASVDAQGVLHESFALVPMAWLFLVAALYFAVRYWRAPRL